MCGIVGYISSKQAIDRQVFDAARDTLFHRGPDDAASHYLNNDHVALGHRRLSFLDLSTAGRQPMPNEDETLWLVCNGEIYNYRELRAELEAAGHRFRSTSDSEVILHGYEQWGTDVVHRLKGMFAFGLWDEPRQQLWLVRDRFGIKPLYYRPLGHTLMFASEIKAIKALGGEPLSLSITAFCEYLMYRYVPSPGTIYRDVQKLPPGCWAMCSAEKGVQQHCYWQPSFGNVKVPQQEAVERVGEYLQQSVEQHLRADVPVGSFLSGGYDSSALVYYMSRLNYTTDTFAIGFEGWDDSEHQYAELVAGTFGMRHHNKIVGKTELELLETLVHHYDEPIADISIIPTYVVSQAAAQQVKAVTSGEGADELFCGYHWNKEFYQEFNSWSWWDRLKHRRGWGGTGKVVRYYADKMAMGRFNNDNLPGLLNPDLHDQIPVADTFYGSQHRKGLTPLKTMQQLDIKCFMGELVLTKIDRASMAHSLEVRVPFLDHELFDYVLGLHESVYFREQVQKYLLHENIKQAMPKRIMQRPKRGFVGPDSYYMDIDWYANLLRGGRLVNDHLIQKTALEQLIQEKDHWRLWKLAVFEFWYRKWV